jgi:flagellar protein FlbD
MYLNPDLFERVDTHVDTVVRLIDGTEYVVVEPAEEIVRRIVELRARVIALAGMMHAGASVWSSPPDTAPADGEQPRELPNPDAASDGRRLDEEHAS